MKVIHQSVFNKWDIEDNSCQAVITSPPYYNLRKYSIPDVIIGGDKDCKHKFETIQHAPKGGKNLPTNMSKGHNRAEQDQDISIRFGYQSNLCIHCGAWKGQYGLEPDYKSYLAHSKLWMQEAIRVLREDGIIFVNLADTYSSVSGGMTQGKYGKLGEKLGDATGIIKQQKQDYPNKSKLLIPERFAIMCVDELGLILRNHIVWHKVNGMPESCQDRFSKKWESIFMFVKNPKYYFNLDAIKIPKDGNSLENKNPSDVWNIPTQPSPFNHYAMWAEKLVERMVLCSTRPNDIVLDCFCGSGTTLMVAERLNRIGVGIDLGYKDIQEKRLANITSEFQFR